MTHATGRPRRVGSGGGWHLCNRKKWSFTSTCYATCGNCLRILKMQGREKYNAFLAGHLSLAKKVKK